MMLARNTWLSVLVILGLGSLGLRAGQVEGAHPRQNNRQSLPAFATVTASGAPSYAAYACPPNTVRQGRFYRFAQPHPADGSDYGATHGWGFPGGRWDPSLPRD